MIQVAPNIVIRENDISYDFVRASGPGGQHVNKVATAVQLRYDATGLPTNVFARLKTLAGKRLTAGGEVIIQASRYKSRERNRQDALDRLTNLVRKAAQKPKKRRQTKPTLASKQRTLDAKKQRSRLKQSRQHVNPTDF